MAWHKTQLLTNLNRLFSNSMIHTLFRFSSESFITSIWSWGVSPFRIRDGHDCFINPYSVHEHFLFHDHSFLFHFFPLPWVHKPLINSSISDPVMPLHWRAEIFVQAITSLMPNSFHRASWIMLPELDVLLVRLQVPADNYRLCIVSTPTSPPAISASLISCCQQPGDELQENNNLQDEWG